MTEVNFLDALHAEEDRLVCRLDAIIRLRAMYEDRHAVGVLSPVAGSGTEEEPAPIQSSVTEENPPADSLGDVGRSSAEMGADAGPSAEEAPAPIQDDFDADAAADEMIAAARERARVARIKAWAAGKPPAVAEVEVFQPPALRPASPGVVGAGIRRASSGKPPAGGARKVETPVNEIGDKRRPKDDFGTFRAAELVRGNTSYRRADPPAEKRGMVNVTAALCGDPTPEQRARMAATPGRDHRNSKDWLLA